MVKSSCVALCFILAFAFLPTKFLNAEVVFTNFGPGFTYDKTTGYDIAAFQSMAQQFTPADTVIFDDAIIPLGSISGSQGVIVSLESDSNGMPGSPIEQIGVSNLADFDSGGSVKTVASVLHPTLTSGTPYWLALSPAASDVDATWQLDSTGATSSKIGNAPSPDGPWNVSPSPVTRGAFQIDGTAVPEPSTLALLGLGAVGLLLRRQR
jgi:hypothetical protein